MARLEDLSPQVFKKALEIYFEKAYPNISKKIPLSDLPDDVPLEEVLKMFEKEKGGDGERPVTRYSLQLGNVNYPYMKLVFQEHSYPGEYCFVVDTHDGGEIDPRALDFDVWVLLKEMNMKLKREIERAWKEAGIPTQETPEVQEIEEESKGGSDRKGVRIIVGDDEKFYTETVKQVLLSEGYDVKVFNTGKQALAEVRGNPPDLLILDMEMPDIPGMEVIKALREDPRLAKVPVLLMTAGKIKEEQKEQASGFLSKPFLNDVLLKVVKHLLKEGRNH